jgi:hypothetical protein
MHAAQQAADTVAGAELRQQLARLADDAGKQQVVAVFSLLLASRCHCSCAAAAAAVAAGSQPPLQALRRLQKRVLLPLLWLLLRLQGWLRQERLRALHIGLRHCLLPHLRRSLAHPSVCRNSH